MADEQKQSMRESMPLCAELVDALREAKAMHPTAMRDGAGFLSEGGVELGSPDLVARLDAMIARERARKAEAEAAWQAEIMASPRLAHMYNMPAFRAMQKDRP